MEKSGNMNYVSANNEHHVPLHVKPFKKEGGITNTKIKIILERCKSGLVA